KQYHGEMAWMARHGMMRARPHELLPGTLRVISVRMNYLPANATVYFVLTDRFRNGDPTNDHSYGRHKDGMQEIGTFHGGDLR
ncbi:hypothetical protein MJM43_33715, partial [Salmonella enterica subsp. enterica serovar Montevideo]|nr:hypothetical protein [Salmonella enterica subsp. enterica serovar Montevideo]